MTPAPVTIFATPKAFRGHFSVIQRNAIESWTRLSPKGSFARSLLCSAAGQ